ncbi:MAG TPA: YfhO family protein [Bryobacteraceae bacterium]|nr:YfhO family protein [Bryobacteraceae bacterium]
MKIPVRLQIAALLLVIVAGFYWKLTLTRQYDWMWSPDMAEQVLPWYEVQAQQWHNHAFPLWDPYVWAGQPLLGQAQPGAAYPPNWLLFWLPLRNGRIRMGFLQWYFVMIHLMAAAFCYLLCRDLGLSRNASLVGGLAFALAGYVGTTDWPQMVNGAVWIPLVFLFLLRSVSGKRPVANAALSGMFLGISWLSGHHQVPMFLTLASAGTWLYFIFRSGRLNWRVARAGAVAAVFLILCGAFQVLPATEYGHLAKRWAGTPDPLTWNQVVPYDVQEHYDLRAYSLFGIVFPNVHANFDPFVGVVAVVLAGLAVAARWRASRVPLLFSLALGGLIYAMGHNAVFQGFLYAVIPTLDKARTPSAATCIFSFGTAVLAAYGAEHWLKGGPSPWTRRITLVALGFGILTMLLSQYLLFTNKLNFPLDDRVIVTAFVALLLAALLYGLESGHLSRRQAGALLVLLLLFELGNVSGYMFAHRSDANQEHWLAHTLGNEDIGSYLHNQPGFQRAEVANNAFAPNWGAAHGVEMWGGSSASVTTNLLGLEFSQPQVRELFGVAYTIATGPQAYANQQVFEGQSGMKVFKQPEAFPRAWAVHRLVRVPDIAAGNQLILNHLPDMKNEAFMLSEPPAIAPCNASDNVTLAAHNGGHVLIQATLSCPGMVVLSDTFYPGWRARVDGKPTPIYEVNGAMRGVPAPAGTHTVTMDYRPATAYTGAGLTFAGIAGALLLFRVKRL